MTWEPFPPPHIHGVMKQNIETCTLTYIWIRMLKNEVKDSAEHKGATFNLLQYLMHCYPSSRTLLLRVLIFSFYKMLDYFIAWFVCCNIYNFLLLSLLWPLGVDEEGNKSLVSIYICRKKEIIKSHAFWIQFNFPIRVQRWIRGLNRLFFCQVSEMDNHVMIVLGRLNWILFWVFIFHIPLGVKNISDYAVAIYEVFTKYFQFKILLFCVHLFCIKLGFYMHIYRHFFDGKIQ